MNTPQINDGGPAFPRTKSTGYLGSSVTEIISVGGMTLRDYFAGQAMMGWLSSWTTNSSSQFFEADHVAATAYDYADVMIAAKEVKP